MIRRTFLAKTGGALAAAGAAVAVDAPDVIAQPKFQWRMVTTWPKGLATLHGAAVRFAEMVDRMSAGRLKIQVFAGGELVPPLQSFDAVTQGTVQMAHSAAYYWAGKTAACQWFGAVPFGLSAQGMNAWFYEGGGLKLWEEVYAPFGLVARPCGNTGTQMAGWFKKKINSIDDFKGLKMRIPGLGGKVVAKAGGTVVLLAGGEIFPALERGVIDATEWVGPEDDLKLGLHNAARYNYYPGWHEPGTVEEAFFAKKAYDGLPAELRAIVDHACQANNVHVLADYNTRNAQGLQKILAEMKGKVEVLQLPDSVLKALKPLAEATLEEEAAKDPMARKVHEGFKKFRKLYNDWDKVSEDPYQRLIASA
ncbi:MAG TPA: ABC transporter substrate-binding protein [Methylomirabilota bacterium]|nr:ABC transporter substrate-binding protein [Methylomirabilota bacterium]